MCCGNSAKPAKFSANGQPKAQAKVIQMPTAQEILAKSNMSKAVQQSGQTSRYYNTLNQKRQVYR
jgi:hypothetical protein